MLLLEDLKGMTEAEVKAHLVSSYEADKAVVDELNIVIGYESVGSWGCDSSSFFLLKDKTGELFEVHGSHCSCYGFEGQFTLEPTDVKALKFRVKNAEGIFYTGGYDNDRDGNRKAVNDYIEKM